MVFGRVRAGLAGLALILCASVATPQTTPTLSGSVDGFTINLSWTAVPGATGYNVLALVNGTTQVGPIAVGSNLVLSVPGVPPGAYQVAVQATAGSLVGPLSNVVTLNVATVPPPPPAAPANLSAGVGGSDLLLTWDVNPAGLSSLILQAGTSLGGSDIGTFPLPVGNSLAVGGVPAGNYFFRLFAVGAGGQSAASNELEVAIPGCVAPATIPLNVESSGSFVQASWPAAPGAAGYRLDVSSAPGGGPDLASLPFDGATTTFSIFGAPEGTFYLTLHATMACGPTVSSAEVALTVTPPVRPPAKSLGHAESLVIEAVTTLANQYPGDLFNSCRTNTWMFRVLQRLRQQDIRFGLNWKRGNVGDLSQDVVSYIHSDAPDELADRGDLWMWDIIGGHCGPRPYPNWQQNWNDAGGARQRWTIAPYLAAGFAP